MLGFDMLLSVEVKWLLVTTLCGVWYEGAGLKDRFENNTNNNNNNNIAFFYSIIPQATLGSMRFTMKKYNNKKN